MKKINISPIKSIIAISIPILELALGDIIAPYISSDVGNVGFIVGLFATGLIILLVLYGDVLKKGWHIFRKHTGRNLGLTIVSVAVSYLILYGIRMLLGSVAGEKAVMSVQATQTQKALLSLLGSLTTLMAPFAEEIVFRHVLFYQWRGRKILTVLMFFLSSVAFGLIHWNNFGGDIIQMIPYMAVGAWFALIYYFSKTIWQNILTHLLFNSIQFFSALILVVVAFLQ